MGVLKNIVSKELFKVTSLNSVSILIKICIGFISSKVIAIFVGPSGMALVGNFRNFLSTTEAFSALGFENGLVKYVAEHREEEKKLKATLSTVFITVFSACLIIGMILLFFSEYFNHLVFNDFDYSFAFKVLAMSLPLYIGNTFLIAAINGLGEFKKVVYLNIVGSLVGLLVSVTLIYNFRIEGAILSIIVTPSLLFFGSFFLINREINLLKFVNIKFYSAVKLKSFSSYSLMALVSSVIGPMVFLAIRRNVIQTIGIKEAGYWEAMSRMSSYYFLFISSVLTLYFLPKMAVAKSNSETKKLIWTYYRGIIPVFIVGLIIIYVLKDFIIQLILTKEFLPVSKLFFWQLIGDLLKACSYILGFQFYAKKLTKAFILSELFSLCILYFSSVHLISIFHLQGIVMAHAVTYLVYLIVLGVIFRKSIF